MDRRLHRLVAGLVLGALAVQALVGLLTAGQGPVSVLPGGLHGRGLVALLLALTVAGDGVSVRARRGEQSYEFTLLDAVVVADVLLLPTLPALLLPALASLVTSLGHRRQPLKALFNCANLGAATAVLVLVVQTLSGPGQGMSARTVLALVLGMLAFDVINLLSVSHVLAAVGGGSPWALAAAGGRMSALVAVGTVAIGGTAVAVAGAAPALLPFTLVPAAALTFAYRATVQESEERERASRLLAVSQVLAGRLDAEQLTASFASLTRQAFGADLAVVVLVAGDTTAVSVLDDRDSGADARTATAHEVELLGRTTTGGAAVLRQDLPPGWRRALVAPLEAEGRPLGAVVLAVRDRGRRLGGRELTLLTPLASALAVALRGAAHLDRLVEETSKLQAVVDQSSDGILVLDDRGRVQLWSPAVEALTAVSAVAAAGRPLAELLSTSGADGTACDAFLAARELLTPGSPRATVELTLRRSDGELRVVRCGHAAAFDGDGVLVRDVVIVHDITRERQVERLKADFIATVSHELRTPVTPIKGYADLLRRRGDTMTDAKRAECLDVISDRATHLARLVEDLLLASRISAAGGEATTRVDLADGDLCALVRRAGGDFGPDGERIDLDVPGTALLVRCDPVRTIQVLTNLLGNALKYSRPGSPVRVRLRVVGGQAVVEVEDRGRGIPADQLERVFEKFHRVEDPMRMTTGGTGLGLYIARELALAMGGTLRCSSTLGVGSVFRFALGLSSAASPSPVQTGTHGPPPPAAPVPPDAVPRPRRAPPWAQAPPRPRPPGQPDAVQPLG